MGWIATRRAIKKKHVVDELIWNWEQVEREWSQNGHVGLDPEWSLPPFCPNGHRIRTKDDLVHWAGCRYKCKRCEEKAETEREAERKALKAKMIAERNEKRKKLGVAAPGVIDPIAACPKCGRVESKLDLMQTFRFSLPASLGLAHAFPSHLQACDLERGCPEGEHIHVCCTSCRHWYPALCADARPCDSKP